MKLLIIDYGAGNLRSVVRAVAHAGGKGIVSACPEELRDADAIIMPGVGAAADTMHNLAERGLVEPIREFIASGRPFFGVCMGQQVLFDISEEGGEHPCLGVLHGRVRRFSGNLKVPHIGWNQVNFIRPHPMFDNVKNGSFFYFVHSYYPQPKDEAVIVAATSYGVSFPAAVANDNIFATQFHPEKSGMVGLQIYRNFLGIASNNIAI